MILWHATRWLPDVSHIKLDEDTEMWEKESEHEGGAAQLHPTFPLSFYHTTLRLCIPQVT